MSTSKPLKLVKVTLFGTKVFANVIKYLKMSSNLNLGWVLNAMISVPQKTKEENNRETGEEAV